MKKLRIFALTITLLLIPVVCFGLNTTTIGTSETTIEITGLDADWLWLTELDGESNYVERGRIQRITFYPSAASDRMIIRDGGIDAATFFDSGAVSGADDPRTTSWVNPQYAPLVIDISDCTLSTPANAKVVIHLMVK